MNGGVKLIESVANVDDTLLARFLEDHDSITEDEIVTALRKSTIQGLAVPVICGAAFKNKGIQNLLDAVIAFLPSPVDIGAVTGIDPRNDNEVTREPDDNEPLAALAFKIATDPFVGRLVFLRIYSGVIHAGDTVLNTRTGKETGSTGFSRCTQISRIRKRAFQQEIFVQVSDSRILKPGILFVP